MSIQAKLDEDLKNGMRAREQDKVACIRQLRSKVQEAQNAPDFKGPADDAFYQKVIGSYVKSLEKGIAELVAAGERGKPLRDRYGAEITYLQQFLPKLLDEAATKAIVDGILASHTGPRQVGALVGAVMKDHKGSVDPALVRRLVEKALAPS